MVTDNIPRHLLPFQSHLLALLRELSRAHAHPSTQFFQGQDFPRVFLHANVCGQTACTQFHLKTAKYIIYMNFIDWNFGAMRLPHDAIGPFRSTHISLHPQTPERRKQEEQGAHL